MDYGFEQYNCCNEIFMTEQKLNRANHLFYDAERMEDIEKEIWKIFEGEHNEEFKQIHDALFVVKAKFLKEFESIKCD